MTQKKLVRYNNPVAAFTLVELLTVMAIIAILCALVLAAGSGIMKKAMRVRATNEIGGMSAALEGYKTDNGIYPVGNTTATSGSILTGPPAPGAYPLDPVKANAAAYQNSSEALYQALTGQAYFTATPVAGVKSYISLKQNQIGIPAGPMSYIMDPWGNAYGYSTGDNKTPQVLYPNNGTGQFDLWSTGGTAGVTTSNPTPINSWITNWQ